MNIGLTGHQARPGIDLAWVQASMTAILGTYEGPVVGWSSLAKGTDQLFARTLLAAGGEHVFVWPAEDYEATYAAGDLATFREPVDRSAREVRMQLVDDAQQTYLVADRHVVDACDLLLVA